MKKPKFIAIVLVLTIFLMGTGYAAWSETVTINNTVETGKLSVEFVDNHSFLFGIHPYAGVFDDKGGPNYLTAEIDHGAKTTTFTVEDMYPGSTAFFEVLVENKGSIPAEFDYAKVNFLDDCSDPMKEELVVFGGIKHWRPGVLLPIEVKMIPFPFPWDSEDEIVRLNELESILNSLLDGMELEVGDFITFDVTDEYKQQIGAYFEDYDMNSDNCLFFHLPTNVGSELENQTAKFEIKLNFKQFNK